MKTFIHHALFDRKEVTRFLSVFLCVCLCLMLFLTAGMDVAFCAEEGDAASGIDAIEDVVTLAAGKIYQIIRAVIIPIVIVAIAYAGLSFLVGGSRGTETARKYMIGSFIAIILVVFAPIIGNEVGKWFSSYGSDTFNSYNPLD